MKSNHVAAIVARDLKNQTLRVSEPPCETSAFLLFKIGSIAGDDPLDIALKQLAAEVDQEPDLNAGQPYVCKELFFVHACQPLDRATFSPLSVSESERRTS